MSLHPTGSTMQAEAGSSRGSYDTCDRLLSRWNYYGPRRWWWPQRIVATPRCGRSPVTARMLEVCGHCQHWQIGNWCDKCIEDLLRAQQVEGSLYCLSCRRFAITLIEVDLDLPPAPEGSR